LSTGAKTRTSEYASFSASAPSEYASPLKSMP
jgi:hypothetical protein